MDNFFGQKIQIKNTFELMKNQINVFLKYIQNKNTLKKKNPLFFNQKFYAK